MYLFPQRLIYFSLSYTGDIMQPLSRLGPEVPRTCKDSRKQINSNVLNEKSSCHFQIYIFLNINDNYKVDCCNQSI